MLNNTRMRFASEKHRFVLSFIQVALPLLKSLLVDITCSLRMSRGAQSDAS